MKAVTQVKRFESYGWYVMTHERLAPNFMSRTTFHDAREGITWSHVSYHASREDAVTAAHAYERKTGHPVCVYHPAVTMATHYEVEDVA